MTRDEAIAKAKEAYLAAGGHCSEASFAASIAAYEALGMLKLEEPKSAREKFKEVMRRNDWPDDSTGMLDALRAFDASQK